MIIAGIAGKIRSSSKYKAKKTAIGDLTFHSAKESRRYLDLKLLEAAGRICDLELQVPFELNVNGIKICKYVLDFRYKELQHGNWREVHEDVKGFVTPLYRLKKKLMLACFGIAVVET